MSAEAARDFLPRWQPIVRCGRFARLLDHAISRTYRGL